jgi:hypothetical protein
MPFPGFHPLKSLVDGWLAKLKFAEEHKQPWQNIADQCQMFFAASTGFLWDQRFKHKFWKTGAKEGAVSPKFQITIAKAFELVSIFGPMLYWRNPIRTAEPRTAVTTPPDLLAMEMGVTPEIMQAAQQAQAPQQPGLPGQNGTVGPQAQFARMQVERFQRQLQQTQQQSGLEQQIRQVRADLMLRYLNWTPSQLRLHSHAEMAITEALIKGRGVLFCEPYRPPGSDVTMIGSFWQTVDALLIDPDAESVEDAWWISRWRMLPTWKAERIWGLKAGTLKDAGGQESLNNAGEVAANKDGEHDRLRGKTQDLIKVHEIWTRCGVGARLTDVKTDLKDQLERWTGDYCYLAIAPAVPFPLNMPSERLMKVSNEEVERAFRWPTPHWRDGKWPCAILDFYRAPRSVWPVGPLAPGLGELIAINVFIAHLANRIWLSSRDFIAVLESMAENVEKVLNEGKDLQIFRIPEDLRDNLGKVVEFIQHPPVNMDAWKIVEALIRMFEQRTGLSEILYGMQSAASRSATDASLRQQNVSHRPEHMAAKVEEWMTEAALREAMAVAWHVKPPDVQQLLGKEGARLWQRYITDAPMENVIWDIDYRIEAASARKPNRERDVSNIHEALPIWGPILQAREQTTGDFGPLNWLMQKWGEFIEMDTTGMRTQAPPPPPGPDPQQQAAMMQQMEQAEFEAEQGREQEKHQQGLQEKVQAHQQGLQQKAEVHQQEMVIRQRKAAIERALQSAAKPRDKAGAR